MSIAKGPVEAEAYTILTVGVLGVTGFLTNLSPVHAHHAEAASPSDFAVEAQGLSATGTVEPAAVGENTLRFSLTYRGAAVEPESLTVRASLPAHDLGPLEAEAVRDSATDDHTVPLDLPLAGDGEIEVIARVDTFTESIARIPVTLP